MSIDRNLLIFTNVTPKDLLQHAYQLTPFQIIGPDFISSHRFDVSATFPTGSTKSAPAMLRALLRDRFAVCLHRETRIMNVFDLLLARNGSKLKRTQSSSGLTSRSNRTRTDVQGQASMAELSEFLSLHVGRPVLDKTSMSGNFDFSLSWSENDLPDETSAVPSIATTIDRLAQLADGCTTQVSPRLGGSEC